MIITKTPLRISLLGGNTDFPKYFKKYGGVVLTTTIDKYVYCILKERFDDEIWINYSIKEKVKDIKDIKHDLVREAMKLVGVTKGVEITFLSDIPSEGSGLGSSSALTVGLLNALHTYKNEPVTNRQLAEEACRIEVDILKKPIGYQDQYAIAFGGTNLITFGKKVIVKPVYFVDNSLVLIYTGQTRDANEVLSNMKLNKKILDENKLLVYKAIKGEYIGNLLNEYWELKKKLNPLVTNSLINNMYHKAMNLGAIGGKIVGAGAGGFMLFAVEEDLRGNFIENMNNLGYLGFPFKFSNYGSQVIFNIHE